MATNHIARRPVRVCVQKHVAWYSHGPWKWSRSIRVASKVSPSGSSTAASAPRESPARPVKVALGPRKSASMIPIRVDEGRDGVKPRAWRHSAFWQPAAFPVRSSRFRERMRTVWHKHPGWHTVEVTADEPRHPRRERVGREGSVGEGRRPRRGIVEGAPLILAPVAEFGLSRTLGLLLPVQRHARSVRVHCRAAGRGHISKGARVERRPESVIAGEGGEQRRCLGGPRGGLKMVAVEVGVRGRGRGRGRVRSRGRGRGWGMGRGWGRGRGQRLG